MTLTQAGTAFMDDHRCNAYCRAGRHATTLWCNTDQLPVVAFQEEVQRQFGFLVEHLEPAAEARLEGHIWGWTTTHPVDINAELIRDFPAFLVIFTVPAEQS